MFYFHTVHVHCLPGQLEDFITVQSARMAIGSDAEGRLVIVQIDGKTHERGLVCLDLYRYYRICPCRRAVPNRCASPSSNKHTTSNSHQMPDKTSKDHQETIILHDSVPLGCRTCHFLVNNGRRGSCLLYMYMHIVGTRWQAVLQWSLSWKTILLAIKICPLKTGGLWWLVQLLGNVGASARGMGSFKMGGLSRQVSLYWS